MSSRALLHLNNQGKQISCIIITSSSSLETCYSLRHFVEQIIGTAVESQKVQSLLKYSPNLTIKILKKIYNARNNSSCKRKDANFFCKFNRTLLVLQFITQQAIKNYYYFFFLAIKKFFYWVHMNGIVPNKKKIVYDNLNNICMHMLNQSI